MSRGRYAFACIMLMMVGCVGGHPTATRPETAVVGAPPPALLADVDAAARRIVATSEAAPDVAWNRLAELVDRHGHRISGSRALERALRWAVARMRQDGLDGVRLEPVRVPHWVRGEERARIVRPVDRPLVVLGLGGSVGTAGALRAPLVVFDDLPALRATTRSLAGTIVLVNHRMAPYDDVHDDPGYLEGVQARLHAASAAAAHGARAVLVRSVTAVSLRTPHTGALEYASDLPKIPAAAVTIEDAELLVRLARQGPVEVELLMGARTLPDAPSANAVAEIRGSEHPEEIVLLGAHIDSWDVGQGASDDGAGCIAVMEALRLLRASGLVPKRTIRAVLYTAEEYGLAGAKDYHRRHRQERHVAAFETDYGMAAPDAIGVGGAEAMPAMTPFLPAFASFGIRRFRDRAFGSDVAFMVREGAAAFSLIPDGRHYFDLHHTDADTLDKVRSEDLRQNAGAIALLAYLLAMR